MAMHPAWSIMRPEYMETGAEDPFGWVGFTVDGKYRVDAVVGEGGFGIVYRAHHLGFGETVAIKCLRVPASLAGSERERFFSSFMAEGRLLHQLSRSTAGIVQALDVGAAVSPSGTWTPYLVLEWLEGQSLEAELEDRTKKKLGGRPLGEAITLLDPAARALAVAHEQGVAHRDIKPANLFISTLGSRQTLKVLDFGIAKVLTETASLTKAFEATGRSLQAFTPRYGAPEQFSRRFGATGPWTDVFSLALVLVEVVCGHSPLEGEDAAQLFVASADVHQRPTLRPSGVETTDEVEGVLACALSVDIKQRYLTAGEFWNALVAAASATTGYRPPMASAALTSDPGEASLRELRASLLDTTGPPPSALRSSPEHPPASPDAATQLASSTQLPLEDVGRSVRLTIGPQPTAKRFAIAVAAGTAAFALAAGGGYLVWRGKNAHHDSAQTSPSSDTATPVSTDSSEPAPPPGAHLAAIPPHEIDEGRLPNSNVWVNRFRVLRLEGDGDRDLLAAHHQCLNLGMELCTEPQWIRACAEDPKLGATPSWTITGDAKGFVVRGGHGCATRAVVGASDSSPDRAGLCCNRAVAIDTVNSNHTFFVATEGRILGFEKSINQRNSKDLVPLLDDWIVIDGTRHSELEALAQFNASFQKYPDEWLASSTCAVSVQKTKLLKSVHHRRKHYVESVSWTADCDQVRFRSGLLADISTRYIFTGDGRLRYIADLQTIHDWSKP
jgi:serine/threonine protein kinase